MSRRCLFFVLVLVAIATAILLMGIDLTEARAAGSGACSARQARSAMLRERAQYREALRVYEETRRYSREYGADVGRWVRLSRRVGWPWAQIPTLQYVTYRESRGLYLAQNPSGATGLLQIMPMHVEDPSRLFIPQYNLRVGLRLFRESGWSPWVVE